MCYASLNFTDPDTGENTTIPQADLTITGNLITFDVCSSAQLTTDRNYSISVTAQNVAGDEISCIPSKPKTIVLLMMHL